MLLPLLASALIGANPDPHRQFDFWIGEWSVQNRHMDASGMWRNGDVTRARITPVCGGGAILEEWAGPFRGGFQNGFSLRAWNPERELWELLLFWTMDGNGGFGTLEGAFRHGRGEFFTNTSGPERTRYSFSDALPTTVRWDSATTKDAGVTWKTDWIMEFSRTRAAAEVTQDELFRAAWTTGELSPWEEARKLDWMLGAWDGVQVDAEGVEREARLRCKPLNQDCLILDLLETRAPESDDWDERLTVRGFEARPQVWSAWTLDEHDTILRSARGAAMGEAVVFTYGGEAGEKREEVLVRLEEGRMTIEELRTASDGSERSTTTTLERRAP